MWLAVSVYKVASLPNMFLDTGYSVNITIMGGCVHLLKLIYTV